MNALSFEYIVMAAREYTRFGKNGKAYADIYRKLEVSERKYLAKTCSDQEYTAAALRVSFILQDSIRDVLKRLETETYKPELEGFLKLITNQSDRKVIDQVIDGVTEIFSKLGLKSLE